MGWRDQWREAGRGIRTKEEIGQGKGRSESQVVSMDRRTETQRAWGRTETLGSPKSTVPNGSSTWDTFCFQHVAAKTSHTKSYTSRLRRIRLVSANTFVIAHRCTGK